MAPSRLALALAKHLANIYDARNWRAINNERGGRGELQQGVHSGPQWVSMCVRLVYVFFHCIFCMLVSGLHAGAARSRVTVAVAVADLVTARQVGKARH